MNKKEAYVEKMKAKMEELHADIAKLQAKAKGAKADTKINIDKQTKHLQQKLQEGKSHLVKIAESTDDAWESLKKNADDSWSYIKKGVDDLISKF